MKVVFCTVVVASATDTLEKMGDHINSLGVSWTAAAPSRFDDFEDVKQVLGTILKGQPGYIEEGLEFKSYDEGAYDDIPAEFDVRMAFPECAEVSGNIRDQSNCGSCWAFGSTEAFNDRHCIATGDTTKFSVEDTTANCDFSQCFSMGCGGGQPGAAWRWFKSTGVVTGGDYTDIGRGDTCAPYSLAPCAHHVPATAKYPACSEKYPTPSLSKCSESGYSKSYKDDKIKATSSYNLDGIKNIQADMVKYGSATAAFTVYADFPTYKSGVYKHTSGSELGGHAVKLLGWGTENGEDYWLVANSWNEQWGDHGTFKIARGNNECGIEGQVGAGTAGSTLESKAQADFSQLVCKDRQCSTDCEAESYTFNDCLPVVGGGSARGVSCCDNTDCVLQGSEFGLVLEVYQSDSCTGSSRRMKEPVTECDRTSSGDKKFAKFVCGGNSSLASPSVAQLHLQSTIIV